MKKKLENHLVIGAGEVGRSLYNVLKKKYSVSIRDIKGGSDEKKDILHICYPPSKNFVSITKKYIREYNPSLVIIHSTVPVGTTKKIGDIAVHSPIRGVHPNLEKGIRTFVKYFGGKKAIEAERIFSQIGIKTKTFKTPETTELAKILSTTHYAWNIIFCKEVERICNDYDVKFEDVYTTPTDDYNQGYTKLGKGRISRPLLVPSPGKIGGHCVMPNCELLDDWITKIIKKRNCSY